MQKFLVIQDWTSIDEHLPPIDQKVLTCNTEEPEWVIMGYYNPTGWTKSGWHCEEYMDLHLTHWMPIPRVPSTLPCLDEDD